MLRISHPNATDMLLHHKIPENPNLFVTAPNSRRRQRQKRVTPSTKIDWESEKWENDITDYDTTRPMKVKK